MINRSSTFWTDLEADLEDPSFRREFVEEMIARAEAAEDLLQAAEIQREAHSIADDTELAAYVDQLAYERRSAVLSPCRGPILFIRMTSEPWEEPVMKMFDPSRHLKNDAPNLLNPGERGYELRDEAWPLTIIDGPARLVDGRPPRSARPFPDREHIVEVSLADTQKLREWLVRPNGSFPAGNRATLESVVGGSIWIRTRPYRYLERRRDNA